ncbi:MAG: LacI family transcriptional regulator [Planctomycetota bacterium]|nr:LacI family transcriptional regulator [Planctomycetota bacterium]
MARRVRMSDIADALGVSRTTVSRVLSGKAAPFRIATETAERILKEAERRGYQPSQLARGLRTAFSRTIGLLVSDISNPFFANIAWAAEQSAEQKGFAVIVGSSGEDLKRERAYVANLMSRGVDGLIVAPAGPDYEHLAELQRDGFPFVLLDRVFEDLECDWVVVENQGAARALCEALLDRGCERLAFLGGRMETSTARLRLEGYRAALRGRRLPFDPEMVHLGDFSVDSGRKGAEQLLKLPVPPDGIFCANNKILFGCLDRFASAPAEPWRMLPIASFDETPFMKVLGRPLIVAAQPEHAIGARAVELLTHRILSGPPGSPRMNKPFNHLLLNTEQKRFGI